MSFKKSYTNICFKKKKKDLDLDKNAESSEYSSHQELYIK